MNSFEIIRAGINTTFQDNGRNDLYHIGVPFSGAMDKRNYILANSLLGNKKSSEKSWQPHHDSKMNRLKIYIWISQQNYMTHPLFYSKGSHKKIKSWIKTKETRFPDEKGIFEKIYGDIGDIIIFDTHGIHSNFKIYQVERECFIFTVNPGSIFNKHPKKFTNTKKKVFLFTQIN